MMSFLQKPKDLYNVAVNIVRSIGPFLLSQSDQASKAFVQHQGRMATAEAMKMLIIDEIQSITAVRTSLRNRYIDATPEERLRIRRDISESEADIRHFQIVAQSLGYLPDFSADSDDLGQQTSGASISDDPAETISEHWLDKFKQLARAKNEPWRQDLLARALAAESTNPGLLNARTLWLIGTLEESKFKAFAVLLDISSLIGNSYFIPGRNVLTQNIPECELGSDVNIGGLVYLLSDTGLVADPSSVNLNFPKDSKFIAAYSDDHYFLIHTHGVEIKISGITLTSIGVAISILYKRNTNLFGIMLLNEWISTLSNAETHAITKHFKNGMDITCTRDFDNLR